ncbi:MAG: class I adenylate-forming enzyme family protein [Gammaproteobacteria bacterium]
MTETLPGWLATHLRERPHQPAICCGERCVTYAEFAALAAGFARLLHDECPQTSGARVAYLGANSIEMLALVFACAATGCVAVPLNWRLAPAELDAVLADATPAVLFVEDSCATLAAALDTSLPRRSLAVTPVSGRDSASLLTARMPDPDLPVLLCYTSGTTGRAKGAVLTTRTLVCNAWNAAHMHDLTSADRVLTVLPLFHVGGLNIQTLPALRCGAEVLLLPRFDAPATLHAIAHARPTLTVQVPATLQALDSLPACAATDFSSLRAITTGSTDVPRDLIARWHARGVPVIQVYGATETGPVAIYQRIEDAYATAGAIGRAGLHTAIRIVRPDGSACAVGEPGEILVQGDHVVRGYWRGVQEEVFANGWFHSGDVAEVDAHGVYWFRDRLKNVIISGGENIYPAEVERVLRDVPCVREVAVVGRADPHWGAVPVAAIVADPGFDPAAVPAACADRLARYKWPKDVIVLAGLPRTALGKVDLAALRERIAG